MARKKRRRPEPKRYILDDKAPVEEPDPVRWQAWLAAAEEECHIDQTALDDMQVLTEFTGVADLPRLDPGPPKLFKTTVTGGPGNGMFRAYETAKQAKAGHHAMLRMLKKYCKDDKKGNA